LYRSALAFGASFIFTVGRKYRRQSSDTVNSTSHIPYFCFQSGEELEEGVPNGCRIICVEITDNARNLPVFCHPERSAYLLGNEGSGIPPKFMENKLVVQIPTAQCLNLASAGTVVMYDRVCKQVQRDITGGCNGK
jgi:tRNA(Leu) C34 or U34 (ribose-2'-O)-methylase TrmL